MTGNTLTHAKHILYGELDTNLESADPGGESPRWRSERERAPASGTLSGGARVARDHHAGMGCSGRQRPGRFKATTGSASRLRVRLSDADSANTPANHARGSVGLDGSLATACMRSAERYLHRSAEQKASRSARGCERPVPSISRHGSGRIPRGRWIGLKLQCSGGRPSRSSEAKGRTKGRERPRRGRERKQRWRILGNLGRKKQPAAPPDSGSGAGDHDGVTGSHRRLYFAPAFQLRSLDSGGECPKGRSGLSPYAKRSSHPRSR